MVPGRRLIPLGNVTKLDLPVDRVLDGAMGRMKSVVLMGYDEDGDLYFASTYANGGEVLWLLEKCKMALLDAKVEA